MRTMLIVGALVFSATAVCADYSAKDAAADLDRISASLNAIHTLKGEFVQQDPNGAVEQGTVYIQKPGKMRFEYKPPSTVLVVSDGIDVAVFNKKLNTADRYPLASTPLNLLLSDHVNLQKSTYVVAIEHQSGAIVVHARSNDRRTTGNITITFSDPGLELRQWTVVDAQGLATTVTLRNMQSGVTLQPELFLTHG
ncbi:MAG: outer-membrane lipoprotein carrier protein LolA [Alphaproteobacteria bacterium]|nr:outer-membrane lipoprotein carrier protein LolA [Alphaproteobacteria bacterium]MBV9061624.1 outer-membrane lipoprotein carrier protein LolA [Alphaproteobacteria bacterium]